MSVGVCDTHQVYQQFPQSAVSTKTFWGLVSNPMIDAPGCFFPSHSRKAWCICLVWHNCVNNTMCMCESVYVCVSHTVILKRNRFHILHCLPAFTPAPSRWISLHAPMTACMWGGVLMSVWGWRTENKMRWKSSLKSFRYFVRRQDKCWEDIQFSLSLPPYFFLPVSLQSACSVLL